MITANEQKPVILGHIYEASPHSPDPCLVHGLQISILQNAESLYTLIRDGIQIFSAIGNNKIGSVVDRNHLSLHHRSFSFIQIVQVNTYTVLVGIGAHICYIFVFTHDLHLPFF